MKFSSSDFNEINKIHGIESKNLVNHHIIHAIQLGSHRTFRGTLQWLFLCGD